MKNDLVRRQQATPKNLPLLVEKITQFEKNHFTFAVFETINKHSIHDGYLRANETGH